MANGEALQVQLMSGLELTYEGKKLNVVQDGASKSAQLLALLLFYHQDGIPRDKLIHMLYNGEDADAANSLKALVFRLRKRLDEAGLPENDYITIKDGVYRFSDQLPLDVDVERMLALSRAAAALADGPQAVDALNGVVASYRGELLPLLSDEMWVIMENAELTDTLFMAARRLSAYLTAQRDYQKAYALNRRISDLFPFDEEWHVGRMNSLISQGKYQQAMDEYEAVTSMLFDEMGVYPSERIMDCARAISDQMVFALSAAADVDQSLQEGTSQGAYYCSYPSFVDSYRILRRIMSRDGIASCLLLCGVVDRKKLPLEDKKVLVPAIQNLGITLGRKLRKSDMYTRYSPSQMLVMLWGCPPESADISIRRIHKEYLQQAADTDLAFTVIAGDEPPRPVVLASIKTKGKKWKKLS